MTPAILDPADDALVPLVPTLRPGQALQQVKTHYTTAVAVQQPRSLAAAERRLLEEARLAGESFYYGWRAGAEQIEGPSVKLAMAAARCWGNCAVDAQPVQDLGDAWVFTAAFIDLETGYTLTRQFRQSKSWKVHGKLDEFRKEDIRFQIGQSKAARNVVLNALPSYLVDKALAQAKDGVREKIEAFVKKQGLAGAADLTLKAFLKLGVKEADVLAKLEVADRKAIGVEQLIRLAGDKHAIESGQERPEDLFPSQEGRTAGLRERLEKNRAKPADEPAPEAASKEGIFPEPSGPARGEMRADKL